MKQKQYSLFSLIGIIFVGFIGYKIFSSIGTFWVVAIILISLIYLFLKHNSPKTTQKDKTQLKYGSLGDWQKDLTLIKECKGETIEFTHESSNTKKRRKLDLLAILTNSNGSIYLHGFCHSQQENRTFNIDNITTMLQIKSKRYEILDYLSEEYDI
jgi:hypothetical protein